MAFYSNSSVVGVDLNNAGATQLFALGTIVNGSDGSIWQYVQASTTVSAYSVVAITGSGTASMCVLGDINGTDGVQLGIAQNTFAPSDYGFVPVHGCGGGNGAFKVKTSGSVSAGLMIYIGTASGNVTITAAASGTLAGIAIVTAMDTADTAVTASPCIITWPKPRTNGS